MKAKRATAKEAFRLFQQLVILNDDIEAFIDKANAQNSDLLEIFADPCERLRNGLHDFQQIMCYLSEIEILERKTAEKLSE